MANLRRLAAHSALALTLAVSSSTAGAQSFVTGHVPVVGSHGVYGGYHSSTAAEGYLRGYAGVIQARGMAATYLSQAAINFEAARRQYLENRLLQARYNQARAQARAQYKQRRHEEFVRRRGSRLERIAKQKSKNSLGWPQAVAGNRYKPLRNEIEALIRLRDRLGTTGSGATALKQATKELARQIIDDEQNNKIGAQESQAVRRFVRGLYAQYSPSTLAETNSDSVTKLASTGRR